MNIIHSIKKNVPDDFIVGVRISPEIKSIGIKLKDTIKLVGMLKDLPIDFIHLSCWDVFLKSKFLTDEKRTLTQIITESYANLPTIISTGNVWSSKDAENLLKQGADLIGVGRVAIGHPYWATNISDLSYDPPKPPYTVSYLKNAKLNETFISYMKNWKNFVVEK